MAFVINLVVTMAYLVRWLSLCKPTIGESGLMKGLIRIFVFFLTLVTIDVVAQEYVIPQTGESFGEYQKRVEKYLRENKQWIVAENRQKELSAVMPIERRPSNSCKEVRAGVLLVHGLSDSPYSVKDAAESMASRCLLVRTLLLPGHGTKAEDLIEVSRDQWRESVRNAADTLAGETGRLYVAGFSTGGALALDYAMNTDTPVQGLILFSPALKINSGIDWLSPILSPFLDWLDHQQSDDYAKYASIPVPAIAEVYLLAKEVRSQLADNKLSSPVFIAMAEEDNTVDSEVTLDYFDEHMLNAKSQLILYSSLRDSRSGGRIRIQNSYLPEQRITSLSHVAIQGSPENPYYGKQGEYRMCNWYSDDEKLFSACKKGNDIWFGEKGKLLKDKSASGARVSWNPFFDNLMEDIDRFVQATSR